MTSIIRHRLTFANVLSALALFVALGGTGYAASKIRTADILNSAVTSAKLKNGAVTGPKLARGAVSSDKLAPRAVTADRIAPAAIGADKLQPGSLSASLFATGVLGGLSPSKITTITGPTVALGPNSPPTPAAAQCPPGQRAIAGGFNVGSFAFVDATGPTTDGGGWSVTAENGPTPASFNAVVVCAAA